MHMLIVLSSLPLSSCPHHHEWTFFIPEMKNALAKAIRKDRIGILFSGNPIFQKAQLNRGNYASAFCGYWIVRPSQPMAASLCFTFCVIGASLWKSTAFFTPVISHMATMSSSSI